MLAVRADFIRYALFKAATHFDFVLGRACSSIFGTSADPSVLWTRYVQLTQIEGVFKSLKSELCIRPIRHQLEHCADAHILIAFLAYCLQVTPKQRLLLHAPGLTPTAVLEKLAEIKMIDVWIPTVDQRWLILPRYTQPSLDAKVLIEKLKLQLPSQPPPRLVGQKQSYEIKIPTVRYEAILWGRPLPNHY